jgi:hypothetical protein
MSDSDAKKKLLALAVQALNVGVLALERTAKALGVAAARIEELRAKLKATKAEPATA